jgi:hypothetical protein
MVCIVSLVPCIMIGGRSWQLLDKNFWIQFEENPKYGKDVKQQNKQENSEVECTVKVHSRLNCIVKAYLTLKMKRIK